MIPSLPTANGESSLFSSAALLCAERSLWVYTIGGTIAAVVAGRLRWNCHNRSRLVGHNAAVELVVPPPMLDPASQPQQQLEGGKFLGKGNDSKDEPGTRSAASRVLPEWRYVD